MKLLALLISCLALAGPGTALSQVFPVPPTTPGLFGSRDTLTLLHPRKDADITIVVVMGHPGHFGLKMGDGFLANRTARMMTGLVLRDTVKANVVILDSPIPLNGIGARSSSDHLGRIESVVKFYQDQLGRPIWLMGHSDGSISVSEYLNRSEQNRRSVVGAILSAGRDETRIQHDWNVPTLVIHHEKDGCEVTTFTGAQRYFSRIKDRNTRPTEFATVRSGSLSGPPCSTGYHMYEGAYTEALGLIEDFVARHP